MPQFPLCKLGRQIPRIIMRIGMNQSWGILCLIHKGHALMSSLNKFVIISSFVVPPGLEDMKLGFMKVSLLGA